jgi:NAD(P)-dependent dehydrogenase (short-subunit alcohol dehydrogenase family)
MQVGDMSGKVALVTGAAAGLGRATATLLAQAAIPHLLQARGAVVNVTSCAAFRGQAYFAAYCATKAGLTHMTKALAMEYAHQPIRFNAVAPGGMMTDLAMNIRSLQDGDGSLLKRISPVARCDRDRGCGSDGGATHEYL